MLRYGVAFFLVIWCGEHHCVNGLDEKKLLRTQLGQEQFLRGKLKKMKPEQQQDLAMLVPYLQKGDKSAFRQGLGLMVQNGGNDRIQRSLQGLSDIGFDAIEIQRWLQREAAPIPQSKMAQKVISSPPEASATVGLAAGQLAAKGQRKQEVKAKEALKKELAQRLSKGMQAFKRVEALETTEATLQQQLAYNNQRMGRLEEALQKEEQQRIEAVKENLQLKEELQQEEKFNKETLQRVEALEKGDSESNRVAVLEEENVKFRAALAGAARRLINLEADVRRQLPASIPKVVRHQKQPMQPAK